MLLDVLQLEDLDMSVNISVQTDEDETNTDAIITSDVPQSASLPRRRSSFFLHTPLTDRRISTLSTPIEMEMYTPATRLSHKQQQQQQTPSSLHSTRSPGIQSLLQLLHRRAADSKAMVRKAAIQALEALLIAQSHDADTVSTQRVFLSSLTAVDLQVLYDGCLDASVMIRKQSMSSLSALFAQYPVDEVINQVWLGAILPMIHDAEPSIQDKALQSIQQAILDRCTRALRSDTNHTAPSTTLRMCCPFLLIHCCCVHVLLYLYCQSVVDLLLMRKNLLCGNCYLLLIKIWCIICRQQ